MASRSYTCSRCGNDIWAGDVYRRDYYSVVIEVDGVKIRTVHTWFEHVFMPCPDLTPELDELSRDDEHTGEGDCDLEEEEALAA